MGLVFISLMIVIASAVCIAYLIIKLMTSKIILLIILPIKRKRLKNRIFKTIVLANLNRITKEFYYFDMYIRNENFEDSIFKDSNEVECFREKLYKKIELGEYLNDCELGMLNDIITINYHIY